MWNWIREHCPEDERQKGRSKVTRKIDLIATGMNLRAVRMRKGYRAIDVADMMQVSSGSVSHWENGDFLPCTVRLVRLAELYGVPIDSLIIRRAE